MFFKGSASHRTRAASDVWKQNEAMMKGNMDYRSKREKKIFCKRCCWAAVVIFTSSAESIPPLHPPTLSQMSTKDTVCPHVCPH